LSLYLFVESGEGGAGRSVGLSVVWMVDRSKDMGSSVLGKYRENGMSCQEESRYNPRVITRQKERDS